MFKSNVLNNINGKIIFLLDSDDYLLDNAIYTIIEDFKKFDGGIQTIAYSYENDGKQIEYKKVKSSYILKDNHPLNANNNGFKDYLFVSFTSFVFNVLSIGGTGEVIKYYLLSYKLKKKTTKSH